MSRNTEWALVPLLGVLMVAYAFPKAATEGTGIALAVLILEWIICLLWLVYLRRAEQRATFWCEARR